ncbi:hypothetical protein Bbelb_102390 [Branchiostoma belcheri]|nr:hypothetical protein Bbelb_102390 [Branchiostoma belcheri]
MPAGMLAQFTCDKLHLGDKFRRHRGNRHHTHTLLLHHDGNLKRPAARPAGDTAPHFSAMSEAARKLYCTRLFLRDDYLADSIKKNETYLQKQMQIAENNPKRQAGRLLSGPLPFDSASRVYSRPRDVE